MIKSYPYSSSICFAYFYKSGKLFTRLIVILMEVARIDPDLFNDFSRCYGNL